MSEEKEVIETQESKDQSDANKELNKSSNFDLESILGEDLYDFYLKNKNQSIAVVIGLATIIVAFLGYKFVYMDMFVNPTEKESIEKIWQAESIAFDQQNWSKAITGDSLGFFSGFKKASGKYAGYKGGEVAKYNLGISYLNNREYKNAIKTLEEVKFSDELLGTISLGAIGDAYLQLGAVTDALIYYTKAYKRRDNDLTSPVYMMKAAFCQEAEGNYDDAIKVYKTLFSKYPNSTYSINAEKYMESLKLGKPVYKFETNTEN
jgi:tetratricopeptide (TPR) repeat protein